MMKNAQSEIFSKTYYQKPTVSTFNSSRAADIYPSTWQEDQARNVQISQTIQKLRAQENSKIEMEDQMKIQIQELRSQLEKDQLQREEEIKNLKLELEQQLSKTRASTQSEAQNLQQQLDELQQLVQNETVVQSKLQQQLRELLSSKQKIVEELQVKNSQIREQVEQNIHICEIVNQEKILSLQNQINEEQMSFEESMNHHRNNHRKKEVGLKDMMLLKDDVIFKLESELNALREEVQNMDDICQKDKFQSQEKMRQGERIKQKGDTEIQNLRKEYQEVTKVNQIKQRENKLHESEVRRVKEENQELTEQIFKLKKMVLGRNTSK